MQISRKNQKKSIGKKPKAIPKAPPVIDGLLKIGVTLRYQKTSTSTAFVYTNCLGKLLYVANSATVGYTVYEAIRLKRITVRALGIVNNSAGGFSLLTNQITLRMDDGAALPFGSERRYTDMATNASGAVVSAKMDGINSQWINADESMAVTSQRICTIDGPQGSIVDLKATIQMRVSQTGAVVALTGSGLGTGKMYFNYLDNTSTSGTTAGTQLLQNINGGLQAAVV